MRSKSDMTNGAFRRLLLVDDDPFILQALQAEFERRGFSIRIANGLTELEKELKLFSFDGVVLDIGLNGEDGRDAIPLILRNAPYSKIVVLTATNDVEVAADVMLRGATAFVRKRAELKSIVDEIAS